MKYKLIISDYDGTLGAAPINDIDPETLDAINRFTAKGGVFAVCSGREYRSIRKICVNHGLKGLVVSFQGARIHDIQTKERLFSGGLSAEMALQAVNDVKPYGLTAMIYTEDCFYYEQANQVTAFYERAVDMKGEVVDIEKKIKELGSVCKMGWLGEEEKVVQAVAELNQKYKGINLKYNSGAKMLLEAVNPQTTKGRAVRFLADYYNIPLDQVLTVGDSTNDIDLVGGEWYGVAVGDAKEELKAVAKEIAPEFKDKPIKYLIEKYCL